MIYPPKLLADVIDFLESTPSAVTKHVSILICKTETDFMMYMYMYLYNIDADYDSLFVLVTTDENQERNMAGFVGRSLIGKIIFNGPAHSVLKKFSICIE